MSSNRKVWTILASASFDNEREGLKSSQCAQTWREAYKGLGVQVRTFSRNVKAGGAVIALTVVVARKES